MSTLPSTPGGTPALACAVPFIPGTIAARALGFNSPGDYASVVGLHLLAESIGLQQGQPPPPPDAKACESPISTWMQFAAAVGVDDSTVRAHRRRTRDKTRPFFASAAEARAWYARLVAAPDYTPQRKSRHQTKKKAAQQDGPVDWKNTKV